MAAGSLTQHRVTTLFSWRRSATSEHLLQQATCENWEVGLSGSNSCGKRGLSAEAAGVGARTLENQSPPCRRPSLQFPAEAVDCLAHPLPPAAVLWEPACGQHVVLAPVARLAFGTAECTFLKKMRKWSQIQCILLSGYWEPGFRAGAGIRWIESARSKMIL